MRHGQGGGQTILAFAGAAWLAVTCPGAGLRSCRHRRRARSRASSMARRFKLTDGRTVRLIGAKAPMPPLGWRGDDPWPFVDAARDALPRSPRPTGRASVGRSPPRPARSSARSGLRGGGRNALWLQEELIAKGLARVYSFADNRACVAELLARENEARDKRLGVWGSSPIASPTRSTSNAWAASPIPISWSKARSWRSAKAGTGSI